jgi:quinol monooxygenase YgiN
MRAIVVRFDIRDDEAAKEFDALTVEVLAQIAKKEPGTVVYATHTIEGEPLARVFYEVYADDEAFEAHQNAQHVMDFHARKNPLLAGRRAEFLHPGPATGILE